MDLQEKLKLYKEVRNNLSTLIKEYCRDTSYPLQDRWNTFLEFSEFADRDSYIKDFNTTVGKWYNDYMEIDRHRIVHVDDVIESYCDYFNIFEDNPKIIQYKEAVLKAFIIEYEFDW